MNTPSSSAPLRAADLLQLSPQVVEGMYAMALNQLRAGDLVAADRSAGNYCLADSNATRAWLLLGAVRQSMGKLEEAANLYLVALTTDPNNLVAATHAITCFREAGLDASANALFNQWGEAIEQHSDLYSVLHGEVQ